MQKIGFSAEKYIEEQSKYILERIQKGGGVYNLNRSDVGSKEV